MLTAVSLCSRGNRQVQVSWRFHIEICANQTPGGRAADGSDIGTGEASEPHANVVDGCSICGQRFPSWPSSRRIDGQQFRTRDLASGNERKQAPAVLYVLERRVESGVGSVTLHARSAYPCSRRRESSGLSAANARATSFTRIASAACVSQADIGSAAALRLIFSLLRCLPAIRTPHPVEKPREGGPARLSRGLFPEASPGKLDLNHCRASILHVELSAGS